MIYVGNFDKNTNGKWKPNLVHFMPFDEQHGMKKTEAELKESGLLVESLPPEVPGFNNILCYDNTTGMLFYEQVEIPPPTDPQIEVQMLKTKVAQLEELVNTMLGV